MYKKQDAKKEINTKFCTCLKAGRVIKCSISPLKVKEKESISCSKTLMLWVNAQALRF